MSMFSRLGAWLMTRAEGAGIWLKSNSSPHIGVPSGWPMNWWQKDMRLSETEMERFGPVHACVTILSQDLSRLPVQHRRIEEKRVELVTNKAPARVMRKPNRYQSRSDFFVYLMRSLLLDGNAYAYATRNDRYEVDALYPISPQSCYPYIEEQSGEIVYQISASTTAKLAYVDGNLWVPQRDLLHIRLHTPRHPLLGESPITAAVAAIVAGTEINNHNAAFFGNMSRPSGVLRHPGRLDSSAMQRIKDKWKDLTTGPNTGEPAVLIEGMDWKQVTMDAVSSELIKSYNLTERQVAQIYRIPSFLLSDLEKATISNVEGLMRFYVSSALGWYIDHVENALTDFFGLPPNEHIHFDLESALLRGDLRERLDALGKGVQNGIYAPNEARARENLPPVEDGDEVRVQQQLVPLSYGMDLQPPGNEPPPEEPEDTDDDDMAKLYDLLKLKVTQ